MPKTTVKWQSFLTRPIFWKWKKENEMKEKNQNDRKIEIEMLERNRNKCADISLEISAIRCEIK